MEAGPVQAKVRFMNISQVSKKFSRPRVRPGVVSISLAALISSLFSQEALQPPSRLINKISRCPPPKHSLRKAWSNCSPRSHSIRMR